MNTQELEDKYSIAGFKKRPVTIIRGKGAKIYDDSGKEYIDCVAGQGVANIGHCVPEIAEAIAVQSRQLVICPAIFYNDVRAKLLEKLVSISPKSLEKAFLCNSGAEAVETAIKFARIATKKTEIIAAKQGFHGRTFGALSATWKPEYRKPFEPLVPGYRHVAYNSIDELKAAITENTAAILLEVVQGEGGVIMGSREYFDAARRLCDEHGVLLIIDEIQTGFGRTGRLFACGHYNIQPDMMCVAKALGAGIPMGAVLCSSRIEIPYSVHANTFGGYPLACSAALASLKYIEDNQLVKRSEELGSYFLERLRIRGIRGIGLMIAIELKEKPQASLQALMERGVMALPAGVTCLRFLPPLVISKEEIDIVIEKLGETL
jgi:LysW-gamma-L-lysine/LysW-L-ornithine aminotransferase